MTVLPSIQQPDQVGRASRKRCRTEAVACPLAVFPIKENGPIRSAWVNRAHAAKVREYEEQYQYVPQAENVDIRLDAHLGVVGGPQVEQKARRAFRRVEPQKLFQPQERMPNEPIWAYWKRDEPAEPEQRQRGGQRGPERGRGKPPSRAGTACSSKASLSTRGKSDRVGSSHGTAYVLMPEDSVREVRSLERALRKERTVFHAQIGSSLLAGEVSTRVPQEMVRIAVREACAAQLKEAGGQYRYWFARTEGAKVGVPSSPRSGSSSSNGQGDGLALAETARIRAAGKRAHLLAELRRLPLERRIVRWQAIITTEQKAHAQEEKRSMFREERMQRHLELYTEAWERQRDYELYVTLASNFWPLDEARFSLTARPGKVLFEEVDSPTRVIQNMWKVLWPPKKAHRRRQATRIQACYRGYSCRCRWAPLLRLRGKWGRLAVMRERFRLWKQKYKVKRFMRAHLCSSVSGNGKQYFGRWVQFHHLVQGEKRDKMAKALHRLTHRCQTRCFHSWVLYRDVCRSARSMFKRTIQAPAFISWQHFVLARKFDRKANFVAVWCQSHWRGMRQRVSYRILKRIIDSLTRLLRGKKARQLVRDTLKRNHNAVVAEYVNNAKDKDVRLRMRRERARQDLLNEQVGQAQAEAKRKLEAKWRYGRGLKQLRQEMKRIRQEDQLALSLGRHRPSLTLTTLGADGGGRGGFGGTSRGLLHEAKERILLEAMREARRSVAHDFEAEGVTGRGPPAFKCCDPLCGKGFVLEEHYLQHWASVQAQAEIEAKLRRHVATDKRKGERGLAEPGSTLADPRRDRALESHSLEEHPPTLARFDLALRDEGSGWEVLSLYILRTWGPGEMLNTMELWRAINKWRAVRSDDPAFQFEAFEVYRKYLDGYSLQKAWVPSDLLPALCKTLSGLRPKMEGSPTRSERHGFLGMTQEKSRVEKGMFDLLQWRVLLYLHDQISAGFWASDLGWRYTAAKEKKERQLAQEASKRLSEERWEGLLREARMLKEEVRSQRGAKVDGVAECVVEAVLAELSHTLLGALAAKAERAAFEEERQARQEGVVAEAGAVCILIRISDWWLGEALYDEVREWQARTFEAELMSAEDPLREALAQRAAAAAAQAELDAARAAEEAALAALPKGFRLDQEAFEEHLSLWDDEDLDFALQVVQCFARQWIARRRARRALTEDWLKKLDPSRRVITYFNTKTHQTQDRRPFIADRLFPYSHW